MSSAEVHNFCLKPSTGSLLVKFGHWAGQVASERMKHKYSQLSNFYLKYNKQPLLGTNLIDYLEG